MDPVLIKEEHTDTYKYNCRFCNKGFNNWEKLIIHKYFEHKNIQPYKCEICDGSFALNAHLNLHLLEHVDYRRTKKPSDVQSISNINYFKIVTKRKPFKCTNCIYGTKSQEKFSYHLTICNKHSENISDNEPNVCRLCFKKFLTENKLKRHMRYHKFMAKLNLQVNNHRDNSNNISNNNNLSSDQQTYKPFRIKFTNTKNIQQNSLIEIKCSYCNTSCISDEALVEHLKMFHPNQRRVNHSIKMPTVMCQWCNTVITKRNLPRHIKAKHPQVKPLRCQYCSMTFKHFASKKSHILKCHNKSKKCS